MDARSYSRLAAIIFAIIAILQLVRALSGWDLTLNGACLNRLSSQLSLLLWVSVKVAWTICSNLASCCTEPSMTEL